MVGLGFWIGEMGLLAPLHESTRFRIEVVIDMIRIEYSLIWNKICDDLLLIDSLRKGILAQKVEHGIFCDSLQPVTFL